MNRSPAAQLALDTILGKPTRGIPTAMVLPMEHRMIDRIAGVPEGTYRKQPESTYCQMLRNFGCCLVDQYIPENPLSMGSSGYEDTTPQGATTGAHEIVCDGIRIGSPEAVVDHLETIAMPRIRQEITAFNEERRVREIIAGERAAQAQLGSEILKVPYGWVAFPGLAYVRYGYENYFMAYALYPEVMERHFAAQADLALLNNRAVLRAYREGQLPPLNRLDHDLADSRGTLVDIQSLDRLWFPHFARCLEPLLQSEIKLIWHCDGNLSQMVPRLLDVGLKGFQGFQYEDGMDYAAICKMKDRNGDSLFIMAGVSVTRTLPHGTPNDVRREMKWLVDQGPRIGLALACTSSIAPGVPWQNLEALIEGFKYYQDHGRDGK